jgi:hypothetical protein
VDSALRHVRLVAGVTYECPNGHAFSALVEVKCDECDGHVVCVPVAALFADDYCCEECGADDPADHSFGCSQQPSRGVRL